MTQNQMKRRPRPRTNGRKSGHGHSQSRGGGGGGRDGNRSDPKTRNNARQMLDKYKSMARDAMQNNDRVQSEYYFQHAEHYQRVINEIEANTKARDAQKPKPQGDGPVADDDQAVVETPSSENSDEGRVSPKPRRRAPKRDVAPVDEAMPAEGASQADGEDAQAPVEGDAAPKPRRRTRKPAVKPVAEAPADGTAEDAA